MATPLIDPSTDSCILLQTVPPLPIEPTSWTEGWTSTTPSEAVGLADARRSALGCLFGYQTASAETLCVAACSLREYTDKLLQFIRKDSYATQHRRRYPLTFMWCFPAEERSTEGVAGSEVVVMQSAYIVFEYMCCLVAGAVLYARAGMQFHASGQTAELSRCLARAIETMRQLQSALESRKAALGRSQWARLRRQALPLQLQPMFCEYFISQIVHRRHLCYAMRVMQSGDSRRGAAALRHTEETALSTFKAARQILLGEPYLKPTQVQLAQALYDTALRAVVQFRTFGIIQDTELAIVSNKPGIAHMLIAMCERGWWAFEDGVDDHAKQDILERHMELQGNMYTVPMDGSTELDATRWRSSLPRSTEQEVDSEGPIAGSQIGSR